MAFCSRLVRQGGSKTTSMIARSLSAHSFLESPKEAERMVARLRRDYAKDVSDVLTVPEVEKILADVKADDVTVIPTHNHSCWADFTIIATGRSDWHLKNIAHALIYRAKQKQQGAKHMMLPSVQGYNTKWILIDCGKFVVHALDDKARAYFNLETLWTAKTSESDHSLQDLQNAFVKVRPINNSKKKPKPAKVTS